MKLADKKKLLNYLKFFPRVRILVLGDFILDKFVWGSVDRISPEAPVPVVKVNRESYMPGGSLNVANNIRTLGGIVYPSGVLGRDLEGRMLLKAMRREGIETAGIVYDADRPTTLKTRIIAHSQQVVRFDRESSREISGEDYRQILGFIRKKIPVVDVVIVEDYGKGLIRPFLLREVIKLAREYRRPILVDPKEKHFPYYRGATLITPNRKEAYGALENDKDREGMNVDQVGRKLLKKMQCRGVLITLGEDGMALYEKSGKITRIPTAAREVYDVSGAGDTVISVLGLAMAAGASMKDAAVISNLAAGIVVGKLGTATVSPKELEAAIREAD